MPVRRQWSEDELRVLTAIFFSSPFSAGDDARSECHVIADSFNRTPSSIDRQWRNIAALLWERKNYNVGKSVGVALKEYMSNPAVAKKVAERIAIRRQWPLQDMINNGLVSVGLSLEESGRSSAILQVAIDRLPTPHYRIFSSGSHGFATTYEIPIAEEKSLVVSISLTLLGSRSGEARQMEAQDTDLFERIRKYLARVPVKKLPSGRICIHAYEHFSIGDETYGISIRASETTRNDK